MEIILKEGRGRVEVGEVNFDFSYFDVFPKMRVILERLYKKESLTMKKIIAVLNL